MSIGRSWKALIYSWYSRRLYAHGQGCMLAQEILEVALVLTSGLEALHKQQVKAETVVNCWSTEGMSQHTHTEPLVKVRDSGISSVITKLTEQRLQWLNMTKKTQTDFTELVQENH